MIIGGNSKGKCQQQKTLRGTWLGSPKQAIHLIMKPLNIRTTNIYTVWSFKLSNNTSLFLPGKKLGTV